MIKELNYPFDSEFILKKKKALKKELLKQEYLIEKRIAILSGSTIGEIKNILELFLLKYGIKPKFYEGQYNRFYEESVFENRELAEFSPELIYIHTSNKNIDKFPRVNFSSQENQALLSETFNNYFLIWQSLKEKYQCNIIQNNFEPLSYRIMGNSDSYRLNGGLDFINKLNSKLYEYANENEHFFINDLNYLSACYGLDQWVDSQTYYLYRYVLSLDAIPTLCANLATIIKSIDGKNKKALVLDLDNTLWGGVIGDDGIEKIELGVENGIALSYLDFQKYIKKLSELGIILNVCSKNNEETALHGFTHPSTILQKNDFICFKANWEAKHINIENIAKELNILPESLVFVDDNPVERGSVNHFLPSVATPEITTPNESIRRIDREGYFEITQLSKEDLKRNDYYKQNKQRESSGSTFKEYRDYLTSLNMKCYLETFNEKNRSRVTQLINKTNQFNFTTKRYTEAETKAIAKDSHYITLSGRLIDNYGDNGIVTALIASIKKDSAIIDLWVMSCRVFKRELEFAFFDAFIFKCKKQAIKKIKGIYIPTKKNTFLNGFYEEIGFTKTEENSYELLMSDYKEKKWTMEVFQND